MTREYILEISGSFILCTWIT